MSMAVNSTPSSYWPRLITQTYSGTTIPESHSVDIGRTPDMNHTVRAVTSAVRTGEDVS
jgi:hypothetical protein